MSAGDDARAAGEGDASAPSSPATSALLPRRFALGALALVALVGAVALLTGMRVEQVVKQQLVRVLLVPHNAAIAGLELRLEGAARAASAAAADPQRGLHFADCLGGRGCAAGVLDAELAPYAQAGGFTRYRLADLAGEVRFVGPARASALPLSPVLRRRLAGLPGLSLSRSFCLYY